MKTTIVHFIKMVLIVAAFFGMFVPYALAANDQVAMALVCFTGIIMFAFGLFDVVHTYKLEKNPAYGLK